MQGTIKAYWQDAVVWVMLAFNGMAVAGLFWVTAWAKAKVAPGKQLIFHWGVSGPDAFGTVADLPPYALIGALLTGIIIALSYLLYRREKVYGYLLLFLGLAISAFLFMLIIIPLSTGFADAAPGVNTLPPSSTNQEDESERLGSIIVLSVTTLWILVVWGLVYFGIRKPFLRRKFGHLPPQERKEKMRQLFRSQHWNPNNGLLIPRDPGLGAGWDLNFYPLCKAVGIVPLLEKLRRNHSDRPLS